MLSIPVLKNLWPEWIFSTLKIAEPTHYESNNELINN